MATVHGTEADDFIHRAGDGLVVPPGYNEIAEATALGDVIDGGDGDDIVYGDDGVDFLAGNGGSDTLFGGGGDDYLYSFSHRYPDASLERFGGELLSGGDGNDDLFSSGGSETLDGGDGYDRAEYDSDVGDDIKVNLESGRAVGEVGRGGKDTLISVESVAVAGHGDAVVIGDAGANALFGDFGDDRLRGQEGDDTLGGGEGADLLRGGPGEDWALFGSFGPKVVNLAAGIGQGSDAEGDRYVSIEHVYAGFSDDRVIGTGGANHILGLNGDDRLTGRHGNDTLEGGDGNDHLCGGAGADELWGDGPTSSGFFGSSDSFLYRDVSASGVGAGFRDIIRDFDPAEDDRIVLTEIDADTGTAGDQAFTFIGAAAFSGTAGELRYEGGIVGGDVDGDGAADFEIELSGAPVLTAAEFAL